MSRRRGPYRPVPATALQRILDADDREEALRQVTRLLARSWHHGYIYGWRAGVQDATATTDDPDPQAPENPYE